MDFAEYQARAGRTAGMNQAEGRLAVAALGLTGEAGEVAELVKKHLGHGHKLEKSQVVNELGDVLWYVAEVCNALGIKLNEVAQVNVTKLQRRYPAGFDPERSRNRTA